MQLVSYKIGVERRFGTLAIRVENQETQKMN
jgi:hypothetical protein